MKSTNQLTEADIHFATKVMMPNSDAGTLVKTKLGIIGRTYNSDGLIKGKQMVYCTDGSKMLCKPENLTLIGFID